MIEKQGEKPNNVCDKELSEILGRVICRYINDPNIPYTEREKVSMEIIPYVERLEKQGEQKSVDKVEPKFKVGDTVKDPYGDLYHITEITDDSYKTDDGRFILFKNQEVYTLSNFTAWSKEDEKVKESIIIGLEMLKDGASDQSLIALYNKKIDWLKSLKERYTWKPSDEQVEALEKECIAHSNYELCRLLEQLKKLKG